MSHVVELKTEITSLSALERAAESIGMELVRGQGTYNWWGHSVGDYPLPVGFTEADLGKCSHAVRVKGKPDAYEIGVVEARDGGKGYRLFWDFYAGGKGLQAVAGEGCRNLLTAYNTELIRRKAKLKGKVVLGVTKLENGWTKVTVAR